MWLLGEGNQPFQCKTKTLKFFNRQVYSDKLIPVISKIFVLYTPVQQENAT